MQIIKAPNHVPSGHFTIFLAGSIEMDKAIDWQTSLAQAFADTDIIFINPRRESWDSSWKQTPDDPQFSRQVNWELDGLERADLIVMYFQPDTKSPISLLELGLFARSGRMIVCCPEGFWRKGNVDMVCRRFNIPQATDLAELIEKIRATIPRSA